MPLSNLIFYNPWPLIGKKFPAQLQNIRDDTNSLATLIRAATADISSQSGEHDLTGWSIGELDFRNRWRLFYDKTNREFKIQHNTGTESAPVFADCLRIRASDCGVVATGTIEAQGGFYNLPDTSPDPGDLFYLTVAETAATGPTTKFFSGISKINLNSNFFYIEQNPTNTDEVTINFRGSTIGEANTASNLGAGEGVFAQKSGVDLQFKSLVAGTGVILSSSSSEITITSPVRLFYLTVAQTTPASASFSGIKKINFNPENFYVQQNSANVDEVTINFRGAEVNTASNLGTGEGVFAQKLDADLRFKSLVAGVGVALASTTTDITVSSTVPGYYLTVAQTTPASASYSGIGKINFNADSFYVNQNSTNPDEVIVNFKGSAGEVNTASNLGAGEGVFAQKINTDLQLKSLLAGAGVSLSSTSTDITIASTVPGYYLTVAQTTPAGKSYSGIGKINFNSDSFYVEQNSPNTDEVIVNFKGSAGEVNTASNLGSGEGVFAQKINTDLQLKSLVAGAGVALSSSSTEITVASTVTGFYLTVALTTPATTSYSGIGKINFNADNFYLEQNSPNTDEIIVNLRNAEANTASNVGPGSGIFAKKAGADLQFRSLVAGPGVSFASTDTDITVASTVTGFYLTVAQTTPAAKSYSGITKINFHADNFYVDQNSPNTDEVIVNLKGGAGSGEANTASNLGSGQGVFSSKVGVDLQFKSLTAGSNITLTPSSTDITIAATGGGTITFAESEASGFSQADTVVKFDSTDFYLSTGGDGNPLVSLTRPIGVIAGAFTNVVEFQFTHNLNTSNLLWSVFNNRYEGLIPEKIDTSNPNTAFFYFAEATTGRALVSTGGSGGVSVGTVTFAETEAGGFSKPVGTLKFDSSDFYLSTGGDGNPVVSMARGTGVLVGLFTSATQFQFDHNLNTSDLLWGVYNSKREALIPAKVDTSLPNTAFFYFATATTGRALVSTGIGPGGGTIQFAESEVGGYSRAASTIKFDSAAFYVSSGGDGFPLVSSKHLIETMSGMIETVAVKDYVLEEYAEYRFTIDQATLRTNSGGGEGAFYIGQIPIIGLDPFYFGNIRRTQLATSQNTAAIGNRITFSVPKNLAGADLAFTVKTTRL